jgi:hypothetical protein
MLWSPIFAPHWVTAESPIAMNLNIAHGALAHQGQLNPKERSLRAHWDANPSLPWQTDFRHIRY